MATLRVHLRDTATGADGWHEEHVDPGEDTGEPLGVWDGLAFFWTDGNAACDCSRGLMLARARGEAADLRACGTGRVVVVAATIDGAPFAIEDRP